MTENVSYDSEMENYMEKWVVSAKKADFKKISEQFGIDQVTARIIRNREVIGEEAIEEYLHGTLEQLHDPKKMKDMEKAVSILQEKIFYSDQISYYQLMKSSLLYPVIISHEYTKKL